MGKRAVKRKKVARDENIPTKKRQKKINLPDLDFSSLDSLDDHFSDAAFDDSFYTSCTHSIIESDDEDLFMMGTPKKVKEKTSHYVVGDLAWVKNDAKNCYWPAYIKSVSKKRVSILYLCYNKFIKGEKSFHFNVNTTKIKPINIDENQSLVKNAREWCKTLEVDVQEGMLTSFNEALELAETYIIRSRTFTDDEKFEFFRTKGLSYYHKQCIEENRTTPLKQLPNKNMPDSLEEKSNDSPILQNINSNKESCIENSFKERPVTENRKTAENIINSEILNMQNKSKQLLLAYNKRNENLVKFITNGKCRKHLINIFNHKTPSKRMELFSEKWSGKKNDNLEFGSTYFKDENQLRNVCLYLQNFIEDEIKDVEGLVKRDDLLFHVFLPEATVNAITKVRRRTIRSAEQIFATGFSHKGLKEDPQLTVPLTQDDRERVHRRYFNSS